MPRFQAKPVIVEALQFTGDIAQWPEQFRLAVRRHLPGGITEIVTGDGVRAIRFGDWVVHGPSGQFSVWREAEFETCFAPVGAVEVVSLPDPEASPRRPTSKR